MLRTPGPFSIAIIANATMAELMHRLSSASRWLFDSEQGAADRLIPRWLFLRALGLIYFSAFFSLALSNPRADRARREFFRRTNICKPWRIRWAPFAASGLRPRCLWLSSGPHMLTALCWVGMVASLLLVLNLWPRGMLADLLRRASFRSSARRRIFRATSRMACCWRRASLRCSLRRPDCVPGLGAASPPSRASLFLLQWEWFRIYFESGVAKIAEWRSAMAPLHRHGRVLPERPAAHLDRLVRAASAALVSCGDRVSPRSRWSWAWSGCCFCRGAGASFAFCIVTPWEIGVILTANYTFLNYLVLALGFLLLDDRFLRRFLPARWKRSFADKSERR